jgi:subtilisin family serine protease
MKKLFFLIFFLLILIYLPAVKSVYLEREKQGTQVTYASMMNGGGKNYSSIVTNGIIYSTEKLANDLQEAGIEFNSQDLVDYSDANEITIMVKYESPVVFEPKVGISTEGKAAVKDLSSFSENVNTINSIKSFTNSYGGRFKYSFKTIPYTSLKIPKDRIKDFKTGLYSSLGNKLEKISVSSKYHALLMDSVPLTNADDVWKLQDGQGRNITGKNITIAIIDTGIDYTHQDLGGCFGSGCKVIGGYDFVNTDDNPSDDNGHGTHCAGIAASNGILKGVAPDAKLIAYKVLDSTGSGSEDDVIRAIERAQDPNQDGNYSDHVDVISMSLGGPGNPDDPLSQEVDKAVENGVVVVVAAGNSGPSYNTIGSPGCARKAITVGAVYKKDELGVFWGNINPKTGQIVPFSSRGPVYWNESTIDKPDIVAPGVNICSAQWDSAWNDSKCYDNIHVAISGTSMATPHVAGASALLKQSHPEWTPEKIKSALINSSINLWYDKWTQGSGLVDVYHANEINLSVPIPRLIITGKVSGKINITGNIIPTNFQNYTLEYRLVTNKSWVRIINSSIIPGSDVLVEKWDTSLVSDGSYFLRLIETFTDGQSNYYESLIWVNNIYISYPTSGDYTHRLVTINGTASGTNFESYEFEYASQDNPDIWLSDGFNTTGGEVVNSTLATWNVSSLGYGSYILKLIVNNTDGHISEDKVIVRVDNDLHDGWPVHMDGWDWSGFTPTIADIDGDGDKEIIIRGGYNGGIGNEYYSYLYAFHNNGTLVDGWPVKVYGGVLSNAPLPAPSVGDLFNDGNKEVLIGFVEQKFSSINYEAYCGYAFYSNGTPVDGWPVNCTSHDKDFADWGLTFSSMVLDDIDNDGKLEVIAAYSTVNESKIFIFYPNGTLYKNWPQEIPQDETLGGSYPVESPAVGDIDGDGDKEILIYYMDYYNWDQYNSPSYLYAWKSNGTIEDGFPIYLGKKTQGSSPVLVDLDHDGDLEIGFGDYFYDYKGGVEFIHHNGNPVDGWPFRPNVGYEYKLQITFNSLGIGDTDKDGGIETAFGSIRMYIGFYGESNLYLLNKNGGLINGWPQIVKGAICVQPVIGDINGDSKPDIIITTFNGIVYAFDSNGNIISPFPKVMSAESQSGAAIGNVDNDGKVDVVAASEDGNIFVWDLPGTYNKSTTEWPMFRNDERHTGLYTQELKYPYWFNLTHEAAIVTDSAPVNIVVQWVDNVSLQTVIISENSTGTWEDYLCDKTTGQCSLRIERLSMMSPDMTNSFLIIVFATTFTVVILILMKLRLVSKIILPFLGTLIFILLLSIFLFPEVSHNFSRTLMRMGIISIMTQSQTFTHTISKENLMIGKVIGYKSYANDTAGNIAETDTKTFTVQSATTTTSTTLSTTTTTTIQVTTTQGDGGSESGGEESTTTITANTTTTTTTTVLTTTQPIVTTYVTTSTIHELPTIQKIATSWIIILVIVITMISLGYFLITRKNQELNKVQLTS